MKDGKEEIEREAGIEQFVTERVPGPQREQAEHRQAGEWLGQRNLLLEQNQRGDGQIDQEHKAEHQPGPVGQRLEAQEPGGEDQRRRRQPELGAGQPPVQLAALFRPPGRRQVEHVESEQDGQRNQYLVALEIPFPAEEFARPADLHENGSRCRQRYEKQPAAMERHEDQAGIQNGNVAKEAVGIVLPRWKAATA